MGPPGDSGDGEPCPASLTCGGFGGHVAVLVDGLGVLMLRLSNHRRHGRRVDIREDAAGHPLGKGRSTQSVSLAK